MRDDPAYPAYINNDSTEYEYVPGLTKREYLAAMAMQGLLSADTSAGFLDPVAGIKENAARWSVEFADALIAELEKT